jgi:hypothetical protein
VPYIASTKIETSVIRKPSVYMVAKIVKGIKYFNREINTNHEKTILQKTKI